MRMQIKLVTGLLFPAYICV